MMSHQPRRFLPASGTRKRKEREQFYTAKPSSPSASASLVPTKAGEPNCSNRLLAGYMAYEFLTKGTLLGQKFDPARAEAVPLVSSSSALSNKTKPPQTSNGAKQQNSYAEVANIVKADGTHIPGIVNPTELSKWIQMWASKAAERGWWRGEDSLTCFLRAHEAWNDCSCRWWVRLVPETSLRLESRLVGH